MCTCKRNAEVTQACGFSWKGVSHLPCHLGSGFETKFATSLVFTVSFKFLLHFWVIQEHYLVLS